MKNDGLFIKIYMNEIEFSLTRTIKNSEMFILKDLHNNFLKHRYNIEILEYILIRKNILHNYEDYCLTHYPDEIVLNKLYRKLNK